MPIYEYVCSACAHRADILHGRSEPGPHFCPECGAEGTMRKAFAPPTIVFKGSGWAKKDRRSTASKASSGSSASTGDDGSKDSDSGETGTSGDKPSAEAAEPTSSSATGASSDND